MIERDKYGLQELTRRRTRSVAHKWIDGQCRILGVHRLQDGIGIESRRTGATGLISRLPSAHFPLKLSRFPTQTPHARPEEPRVGKECSGQFRSRWSPYH